MSRLKFQPEDFKYEINSIPQFSSAGIQYAAQIAQKKFDEWLEQQTVVWSR